MDNYASSLQAVHTIYEKEGYVKDNRIRCLLNLDSIDFMQSTSVSGGFCPGDAVDVAQGAQYLNEMRGTVDQLDCLSVVQVAHCSRGAVMGSMHTQIR